MAPFHESYYLLISPGSTTTLVQFGLGESFSPPTLEIPTKVYPHASIPSAYSSTSSDESTAIHPIANGQIINVSAFNYLLKAIYKGVLHAHPQANNVPLIIVSSTRWTKLQIELITQYCFESVGVQALSIIPSALAAVYAYGGQQNAIVVDVGGGKTEIVAVVDYSVVADGKRVIPYGGDSINLELQRVLGDGLDAGQIESLKRSEIYEVLSDDDKKKSFFGFDALQKSNEDDDGNIDIAEIVVSGRTREILEQREKNQKKNESVPNSELENNTFVDASGKTITVGKERFQGAHELIQRISNGVGLVLENIIDLNKRQEAWDHVIVIGRTTKITGFVDALNTQLIDDHLIGKDIQLQQFSSVQAAFQSSASTSTAHVQFTQVPNSIKFAKMPEYFPEWKKVGYSDVSFLGAQIVAKQIFTTQNESMYVSKQAYLERGPLAFWDLAY